MFFISHFYGVVCVWGVCVCVCWVGGGRGEEGGGFVIVEFSAYLHLFAMKYFIYRITVFNRSIKTKS